MDLKSFTTKTAKLFDIFCKNSTQKFHVEVQNNFRMTDEIFKFQTELGQLSQPVT